MKSLLWLISLSLFLTMSASEISARGKRVVLERDTRSQSEQDAAQKPWGFTSLQKEWRKAATKVRSAVETYIRTVVTVTKALMNAVKTVFVSVGKLVFRIAASLLIVLGQSLFALLV